MAGSGRSCADGVWAAALLLCLAAPPALGQNAMGDPSISGLWVVGEDLSAATDAIADADGIAGATFAYRWIRVDDAGVETDIGDASGAAYMLAAADEGGRVKVRVSFADDGGNPEARTSGAYPANGSVLPAACELTTPYTTLGTELWTATMIVGTDGLYYGFGRERATLGELSETGFAYDGAMYTVTNLSILWAPGLADTLFFYFDPAIANLEVSGVYRSWFLQVCEELVWLGNAVQVVNDSQLHLNFLGMDWTGHSTRRVRLYEDDESPIALSAKVDGESLVIAFSEPLESVRPLRRQTSP